MIKAVLVVLSKPLPGRDADFNDWYTNIHLRDALRFRGSITAQRFVLSETQPGVLPEAFDWRYLALYDVFDPTRFAREHWESVDTDRMMITDAFDDSVLEDYHYSPAAFRDNAPGTNHTGGVILERMNAAPGQERIFADRYRDGYFTQAASRPGVRSGAFLVYREHGQLMPMAPSHNFVAIYRIDDIDLVQDWHKTAHDLAITDASSLIVSHRDPLTRQISEDEVHYSAPAAIAEEARARAEMGDKIHHGGSEKLAVPSAT